MSGGTYSQNFNSLANSSGTTNAWTDNSTLPGWYASKTNGGTLVTTYRADSGTNNAGAIYSFGTNDANGITDRALGSIASGTPGALAYGVRFTNDTGSAQSNITVSYTGEQWRDANGSGAVTNTLAFSYQISSSPLTNSDAINSQTWTGFSALNFYSPVVDVGGGGMALDGNAVANRQVFSNITLTGAVVQPGQELFLRWRDINDPGSDAGIAVDDLAVNFSSSTNSAPTNTPPSITAQPQNQTNNVGDNVTFTVVAGGTAPLSYQWQSNSVAVPGATNSSFTLTSVTTNLTGSSYFVTVTNIAGSTNSQTATLTVNPPAPSNTPPSITTQPQSQTNNVGDNVTFAIVAGGTMPLSYQWNSNSVAVPGATNSSFTLTSVTTNLNGSIYFVTVTNIAGSTNSQTATLTVNSPASTNSSPSITSTQTRIVRIVAYNIEDDINGAVSPLPGLIAPPSNTNNVQAGGVLEGIGEELVNGNAQPIDVLALEETTSNPLTIAPIVNGLNSFYGVTGMYSNSSYQATESGGSATSGNGPNAMVYNAKTLQLLSSVPVDPPGGASNLGSSSGELREVMRYQFAPAGVAVNTSNVFYIYVSHYKSGSTSADATERSGEAQIVRNNLATLPATARILHVGDFNTGDASEAMYGTLIAPGTNQLSDPLNPSGSLTTNFDSSTAPAILTDSAIALRYRDDYQMMTTNVYYGTTGGLTLVAGTYHAFGNNGTTAYLGSANSGTNTSLANLVTNGPVFVTAAQLYLDLTDASDHLPIVADYTIPIPAPVINGFSLAGTNLIFNVGNSITGGVFTVLMTTNISLPLANWTPLATNTSTSGGFTLTATNAVNPAAPAQFYLLREK